MKTVGNIMENLIDGEINHDKFEYKQSEDERENIQFQLQFSVSIMLTAGALTFPEKWSKTQINSKLLVILYFLLLHLGSAPLLSIFISKSSSSSGTTLNSETIFYIGDFNMNEDIWQVSGFLILYWLCVIGVLGLGMVRVSGNIIIQTCKWIFSIFIVLVDLMTNMITFYLARATLGNENVSTLLIILFSLTWVSNTLLSTIYHKIFITLVPNPVNDLSHRQDRIIYLGKSVEDILFGVYLIVSNVLQETQWVWEIYYMVLILIYCARLYSLAKTKYFINNISHYLYVIGSIFSLALLLIVWLQSFTQSTTLKQNFYPIVCTVTIFTMWAFYRHQVDRLQTILLMQPNQVVYQEQQISYLDSLLELYQHRNQDDWQFMISAFQKLNMQKHSQSSLHNYIKQNADNTTPKDHSFKACIRIVLNKLFTLSTNQQVLQQILYIKLVLLQDVFSVTTSLQQTQLKKQKTLFYQLSTHLIKKKIISIIENQNNKQLHKVNVNPIIRLQKKMQTMWQLLETDVIVKCSKWKKLSNDFYQSQQILQKIFQQINHLSEFNKLYQHSKQDYKNCIEFLSLSLFFYSAVVFMSKRSQQIRKSIDKICKLSFKLKLSNEKQKMLAYKFTEKFCFIELDITENLQQKLVLTINKCDKNAKRIFKCKNSSAYKCYSLNNIFPRFIATQMEDLVCREVRKNNGNVVHIYLTDFQGNVFEAMAIFQIISTEDGLKCVMLISQKEKERVILLDSEGFIQSVGKKYLNFFPSSDQNMLHFSTILFEPPVFQSLRVEFLKQKAESFKKIQLINMREKQEDWFEQVEMVKKWMADEKVVSQMSGDKPSDNNHQREKKNYHQRLNLHKYYDFISQVRSSSRNKFFNAFGSNIVDNLASKPLKVVQSPLQVLIRFKKQEIGGKQFYHISLVNVDESHHLMVGLLKGVFAQYKQESDKDVHNSLMQASINLLHATPQLSSNITQSVPHHHPQSQNSSQEDNLLNIKSKGNLWQQIQQQQQIDLTKFEAGNSRGTIMSWSERLFQNSKLMFDSRLLKFSGIMCGLSVLLSLFVSIGYLFLAGYLTEQQQLMQIDCTVSDTFKLTELLYNTAITYHLFTLPDSNGTNKINALDHLSTIKKSYEQQKQLILSMLAEHEKNYEREYTAVSGIPFYEYLEGELSWMMLPKINITEINGVYEAQNIMDKDKINIKAMQMFMYFLMHVENVINGQSLSSNTINTILNTTSTNSTSNSITEVDLSLTSLTDNFPQLKRLNHLNVQHYSQLTQDAYSKVTLFIIIFISIHAVVTLTVIVVIHKEVVFRQLQTFSTVELYTLIPNQILYKISYYYTHLIYEIQLLFEEKTTNKQKNQSQNRHQMIGDFLADKLQTYQSSLYRDQIHKTQNSSQYQDLQTGTSSFTKTLTNVVNTTQRDFTVLRILVFVIVVNFLFIFGMYKIMIINNTLRDVIVEVGSLMDAQTYLLQAYFDLKGNFIIPASQFDQQFFESLLKNKKLSQVVFNQVALESVKIFSQYDSGFSQRLISLLTDDICQIIKQQLSLSQYNQCMSTSRLQYFDNGIVVTINYLTRKIYQTILESQIIASQYNYTQVKTNIFNILRQKEHWQVDQNIYYIFRMFQLLQQVISTELQTVANITINQCQILIILELLLVVVVFSVWNLVNYNKRKKHITQLYLSLVFLNQSLIGEIATERITKNAVQLFHFEQQLL